MIEHLQQIINGLNLGFLYALIALGYTMVYGVLRFINFAHGEVYMLGAMSAYYISPFLTSIFIHSLGFSPYLCFFAILLCAMLVSGLSGMLIEFLAYRPLRNAPKLSTLITAIGVSLLLQHGGQAAFGVDPKFLAPLFQVHSVSQYSGITMSNIQCLILFVSILLMLLLHFFVKYSKTGKAMRALSFSSSTAAIVGIPVNKTISFTFFLGSALAGAAGVLVALSSPKIDPLMGLMPGLKAFTAAVIGGIGSIPGAVFGALFMGLSETLVASSNYSNYRDALAFILLIIILLFKPEGLFLKKKIEKV